MPKGLSIREFARREGVSDMLVRRRMKSGHLAVNADGSVDPKWIGTDWRRSARERATVDATNRRTATLPSVATVAVEATVAASGDADDLDAPDAELSAEVGRMLGQDGAPMMSKAQAETMKENYLARLRQLQYDRESGAVTEIEEVSEQVAAQYAIVRARLGNIGARVAPRVAMMREPAEIKALIDEEVRLVLIEIINLED